MRLYELGAFGIWIILCAISLTQQVSEAVGKTTVTTASSSERGLANQSNKEININE